MPVPQAPLKVVGCFLGLSRERANARRYPAIHPLDSWSKYPSIVPGEQLAVARQFLSQGNRFLDILHASLPDFLFGAVLSMVYHEQNGIATDFLYQIREFGRHLATAAWPEYTRLAWAGAAVAILALPALAAAIFTRLDITD